jgi:hypothetical protein
MVAIPSLYLLFVWHYAQNMPFEDDWNLVPLIDAALHGHLTFEALWSLHNENRIFLPNLIFVSLGILTHDDLRSAIMLSAVVFVAAFWIYLTVAKNYQQRPLRPLFVIVTGALWFSLDEWHNALWAFQVSWYLILLMLMLMFYFLFVMGNRVLAFSLSMATAVAASLCFLQGLILWPVGLACLAWTLPLHPRLWPRAKTVELSLWLAAGAGTSTLALWGYRFQPLGCSVAGTLHFNCAGNVSSFAIHHLARTGEFVLVELGEVIPNSDASTLWLTGLLGASILILAGTVVIRSLRHRHDSGNCLPVALILFGLLFDLVVAVGRVQFLTISAPQSSYTMPNLLILTAIVTYAWSNIRLELHGPHRLRSQLLAVVTAVVLVVQLGLTTSSGIANARSFDQYLRTGARLVVNLDDIPSGEKGCYALYGVFAYLIFYPGAFHYVGFTDAQKDHLSVFSPSLLDRYRAEGLPDISRCRDPRPDR